MLRFLAVIVATRDNPIAVGKGYRNHVSMRASGAYSTALKEGPGAEHDAASGSCFNR